MSNKKSATTVSSFDASANGSTTSNLLNKGELKNMTQTTTATPRYIAIDFNSLNAQELADLTNVVSVSEAKCVSINVCGRDIQFINSAEGFWQIKLYATNDMEQIGKNMIDTHLINGVMHAMTQIYTEAVKYAELGLVLYHKLSTLPFLPVSDDSIGLVNAKYHGSLKIDGLNQITDKDQAGSIAVNKAGGLYVKEVFVAVTGVFGEDWDEEKTARDHARNAVNLSLGMDYIISGVGVTLHPVFKEYTTSAGVVRTHKAQVAAYFNYYLNVLTQSTLQASRALVYAHKMGAIIYRTAGQVRSEMITAAKNGVELPEVGDVRTRDESGKTSKVSSGSLLGKQVVWNDGAPCSPAFICDEEALRLAEAYGKRNIGMWLMLA